LIIETCRIAHADLVQRFGIQNPRLAVAGLNPHAGEGGAIGKEDEARHPSGDPASCAPRASMRSGRCLPIRCSMTKRARATTWRSACITIRR
jgi:hypothetical protein